MTIEERIERFRNEKIAVHCETEEEAKAFVKWCYEYGIEWYSSKSDETYFETNKDKTCYACNLYYSRHLGCADKQFCEEGGYEIITYKDFMKERKMTKLEYAVLFKAFRPISNSLCVIAHICKYGTNCTNKSCHECEFNKDVNLCVQTLLEEHKEPIKIKLTKFEFDLLKAGIKTYGNGLFSWHKDLCNVKEKGYFKDITDTSKSLAYILDNCEVVENE